MNNQNLIFPYAPMIYTPGGMGSIVQPEVMQQVAQSQMGPIGTFVISTQQLMGMIGEIPVIGAPLSSIIQGQLGKLTTYMDQMTKLNTIVAQTSVQSAQLLQSLLYSNNAMLQLQKQNQVYAMMALNMAPNLGGSNIIPQVGLSLFFNNLYPQLLQNYPAIQNLLFSFGASPYEMQNWERMMTLPFTMLNMQNTLQMLMRTGRIIPPADIYRTTSMLIPMTISELSSGIGTLQQFPLGRITPYDMVNNLNQLTLEMRDIARTLRTTTDAIEGLLRQNMAFGMSLTQFRGFFRGLDIGRLGGNIMDLYSNMNILGQLSTRLNIPMQFVSNLPLISQAMFPFSPQVQQEMIQSTLLSLAQLGGQYFSQFGGLAFLQGVPTNWINLLTSGASQFGRLGFAAPMVNFLITRFGDINTMARMMTMPFQFYAQFFGGENDPIAQMESMIAMGMPPQQALNTALMLQGINITRLLRTPETPLYYDLINQRNRTFLDTIRDAFLSAGTTVFTTRMVPILSQVTGWATSYLPFAFAARQIQREGVGFLRRFGIEEQQIQNVLSNMISMLERNSLIQQTAKEFLSNIQKTTTLYGPQGEEITKRMVDLETINTILKGLAGRLTPQGLLPFVGGIMKTVAPFMLSDLATTFTVTAGQQITPGFISQTAGMLASFAPMLLPFVVNPLSLMGMATMVGVPLAIQGIGSLLQLGFNNLFGRPELITTGLSPLEMIRISDPEYLRRRAVMVSDPTLKSFYNNMADIIERRKMSIADFENLQKTFSDPQFSVFLQTAMRATEKGDIERAKDIINRYITPTLEGILQSYDLNRMDAPEKMRFIRTAMGVVDEKMREMGINDETIRLVRENISKTQSLTTKETLVDTERLKKRIIEMAKKPSFSFNDLQEISKEFNVDISFVINTASKIIDFSKMNKEDLKKIITTQPELVKISQDYTKEIEKDVQKVVKELQTMYKGGAFRFEDVGALQELVRSGEIILPAGVKRENFLAELEILRIKSSKMQPDFSQMTGDQLVVEMARQVNELAKIVQELRNKKG
jgi:hypothetical protein